MFFILLPFKRTFLLLKNPKKLTVIKITTLCFIVIFVTNFLGSNAFSLLVFMMVIPFIFDTIEWRGEPSCGRINQLQTPIKNVIQWPYD